MATATISTSAAFQALCALDRARDEKSRCCRTTRMIAGDLTLLSEFQEIDQAIAELEQALSMRPRPARGPTPRRFALVPYGGLHA